MRTRQRVVTPQQVRGEILAIDKEIRELEGERKAWETLLGTIEGTTQARVSRNHGKTPEAKADMVQRVFNALGTEHDMTTKEVAAAANMSRGTALKKLRSLARGGHVIETSNNQTTDFRWKRKPVTIRPGEETRLGPDTEETA